MNLLSKLFGRGGRKTLSAIQSTLADLPVHRFADFESYLLAGSKKIWATWKACDIIAQKTSTTPFKTVRTRTTDAVDVPGLARLLEWPNKTQTFAELLYLTVIHLRLTGNAYWFKSEATIKGDRPIDLYALNPKRISIVPNSNLGIKGYIHTMGGATMPLYWEEVIHFKRPHPNNDYYGIGDLEAGESLFDESINRSTWSEGFWKNGASPSGVLIGEDQSQITDEEEFDKLKRKWQAQYGGSKNSGKTAWLLGKWSYQQLGLTAQEMQNIEASRMNVENIFTMHGVPLSVAGVRDSANYATAKIDNIRFKEYTVLPMVRLLQDSINTDLVAGFAKNVEFQFNLTGLVNVEQAMLDYGPLFDRGGMTINELRDAAGLPVDEDNPLWNQAFINAGLVPLDLSGILDQGRTEAAAQATVQRFIESKAPGK